MPLVAIAPLLALQYGLPPSLYGVLALSLLIGTPEGTTKYLHADLRDVDALIDGAREILDFTEPMAVLILGVLGHIADLDEARALVKQVLFTCRREAISRYATAHRRKRSGRPPRSTSRPAGCRTRTVSLG